MHLNRESLEFIFNGLLALGGFGFLVMVVHDFAKIIPIHREIAQKVAKHRSTVTEIKE